jgi:imidazolonepropionase-like amidohydrolase
MTVLRPMVGTMVLRVVAMLLFALVVSLHRPALAQATSADRIEGLRDHTPRWHAITGTRLVIAPGQVVEGGTLVMRDGVIVAAGRNVPVPPGARVWALPGRTVYAGFIDLNSTIGVPPPLRRQRAPLPMFGPGSELPPDPPSPQPKLLLAGRSLASKNPMVRPEQSVAAQFSPKADDVKAARELGFTSVLASPGTGVFQGQGALINLGDPTQPRAMMLAPRAAQHVANDFNRGRATGYPTSMMGAIALVRQTLYDARWHHNSKAQPAGSARLEAQESLDALIPVTLALQPLIYRAEDEQSFARIVALRTEFGIRAIALGNGYEYRSRDTLAASRLPVIVPLAFPAPPEVENPDAALDVALETLSHWEQAPSNLALLQRSGVEFAITASGLKRAQRDFWPRLRQAIKRGLPAAQALAALTTTPARLIGEGQRLGTLEAGRIANIVVAQGDLFDSDDAQVELAFVDGNPYPTPAAERFDPRGRWQISGAASDAVITITGSAMRPRVLAAAPGGADCDVVVNGTQIVWRQPCGAGTAEPAKVIVAEGRADELIGSVQTTPGALQPWQARRIAPHTGSNAEADRPPPRDDPIPPPPPATYPAGAFGITPPPRAPAVLVRNATVWTEGAAGKLERADLLVRDGRIVQVGPNLQAPTGAAVIDAGGKHVTPGLIDPHSHTAIQDGVNEAASSITAEVRIGDVVDATDISIYRQLAGGVTAANLLHGSANTIGGQSQVIKLRWGSDAKGLKLDDAMPSIKFALGENVKGSNFNGPGRYPVTRMGVEQILRDAFEAARQYRREREQWQKAPRGKPEPRRDLQLDALVEILEGKRVVHIHSYRADEILMFARLARELGITVAAFQHVLEGYKVADAIAGIGAGASSFSDWWAYKMEVIDAIPWNGALLHRAGVLTTFNSDSDELARRLNTEAAKAVKYGGLPETDALAFVTINAARQLRIDKRTGSLEPGKDADFVIWSGHPLSTTSVAEQTWIEGRRYFDLGADAAMRESAQRERERLLAKALPARLIAVAAMAGRGKGMGEEGRGDDEDGADKPPGTTPPMPFESHGWRADELEHALDEAAAWRGSYWSGRAWHECTRDSH